MKLFHKPSAEYHEATIDLVEEEDWELIELDKNFSFNWLKEKQSLVHKITSQVNQEIVGLISLEDIPRELRIFIRLIELSKQHRGRDKIYDHIAGCLIAFSCELAFEKGYEGFVSLVPKTILIDHYRTKYGFEELGNHLFLELERSEQLITSYLEDE